MKKSQNEIRDFIARAPKPIVYTGEKIVDTSQVRSSWLQNMVSGTIHQRINRRSGHDTHEPPFYAPWRGVRAAIFRHKRRALIKDGMRQFCHLHHAAN